LNESAAVLLLPLSKRDALVSSLRRVQTIVVHFVEQKKTPPPPTPTPSSSSTSIGTDLTHLNATMSVVEKDKNSIS
jgi:hypothetical protein